MTRFSCLKAIAFLFVALSSVFADIISGTVLDSTTSAGIAGVRVEMVNFSSGQVSLYAVADANGAFTLNTSATVQTVRQALAAQSVPLRFENGMFSLGNSSVNASVKVRNIQGIEVKNTNLSQGMHIVTAIVNGQKIALGVLNLKSAGASGFLSSRYAFVEPSGLSKPAKTNQTSTLVFAKANYGPRYMIVTGSQSGLQLRMRMNMASITAGTFTMGSSSSADLGAQPPHQVKLSAFAMQETDVTQEQYLAVRGTNPSYFGTGTGASLRPVEEVSWYDAVKYCNALSLLSGLTAVYDTSAWTADFSKTGYRLPTEA
jgi:hypothetical protein